MAREGDGGRGGQAPSPSPQGEIWNITAFKCNFLASDSQFNSLLSPYNTHCFQHNSPLFFFNENKRFPLFLFHTLFFFPIKKSFLLHALVKQFYIGPYPNCFYTGSCVVIDSMCLELSVIFFDFWGLKMAGNGWKWLISAKIGYFRPQTTWRQHLRAWQHRFSKSSCFFC